MPLSNFIVPSEGDYKGDLSDITQLLPNTNTCWSFAGNRELKSKLSV